MPSWQKWLAPTALLLILWLSPGSRVAIAAPPDASSRQGPDLFDPTRDMLVSEVRPGMTGYGLSVFRGTKIERFDVEVVSVLHNFNPQADVVLVRCHGANLEHTGAVAGMSGSPIYLQDDQGRFRLIGAFAYGWPLTKDPVAGVQPIQYMLRLPTESAAPTTAPVAADARAMGPGVPCAPVRWTLTDSVPLPGSNQPLPDEYPFAGWNTLQPNPKLGVPDVAQQTMQLHPLATPLMTAGMPSRLLDELAPVLRVYGLLAVPAGGIAGTPSTRPADDGTDDGDAATAPDGPAIAPGSVLAVPILRGDAEMTAIGTCTDVIGDRVYAFGHSFNNEGPVTWPMGSGYINSIIANLMSSFKLGALSHVVGTINTDQMVGVAGQLGQIPRMVPIELRVVYTDGSFDRTYHFESALHPKLTPVISATALTAAVTSARDLPPYHTLNYDLSVEFADGQIVHLRNTLVNTSPAELFFDLGLPMISAATNPFEKVLPQRIAGTVRITPEARQARLLSVNLPRLKYRPGQTATAYVTYRPFRAAAAMLPIDVPLPRDLAEGQYRLVISDWQHFLQEEQTSRPFRFTAESIQQVFDVLRDVASFRRDALYVRLLRQADGVAIGRTAMPHLPSSRREILLDAGRSNTTPFVSSNVKMVPTEMVMNGSAEFQITIDRNAKVEVGGKPASPSPAKPSGAAAPAGATTPPGAVAPAGSDDGNAPAETPLPTPRSHSDDAQ